jgi:hypothetical protein
VIGLNLGSGQRRFESVNGMRWLNADLQVREGMIPDVQCDGARLPFRDRSVQIAVLHHCL